MRTLLLLFTIIITTNGGVVWPKPQPNYEEGQGVQSINEWSAVGPNEPMVVSWMQYDGSPAGNLETAEPKNMAPEKVYFGKYQFPASNIEQHHGLTYLDHHGHDNPEQSNLNDVLSLKIKEATSAAEARAKEASEKEAILAKWKAEEAELLRELAEKQAKFEAFMIKSKEEKSKKTTQETKHTTTSETYPPTWKPDYSSKDDMRTLNVYKHSENTDHGSDSLTMIMLKDIVDRKEQSYLATPLETKEEDETAAIEKNPSLQNGDIHSILVDNSKSYADAESKIAYLKAKNDVASLTPSEASADLIKPYNGPLASLYVLPSGYLADTDEVFAAKQSHLRALAEAEMSAAQWQKNHAH